MIEGLRKPDSGEITVLGENVWPDPRRIQSRIGVQLQTTSLFDMLTAQELLELFARFYLRADAPEQARRSLAQVGLESKGGDYAKNLSGGQQQRLAIALALVHDPEVVFLDEPTTGLDPQARRNLWDVIRSINQEHGKTVVLTTHYLEEAEELCDRVAIMDEARIVALDTPAGLIDRLDADARVSYTDSAGDHAVYVRDAQATVLEVLERRARERRDGAQPGRQGRRPRGRLPEPHRTRVPRMSFNFGRFLSTALAQLRMTFRRRITLFWSLVFPMILMTLLGLLFGRSVNAGDIVIAQPVTARRAEGDGGGARADEGPDGQDLRRRRDGDQEGEGRR